MLPVEISSQVSSVITYNHFNANYFDDKATALPT